MSKLNKTLLLLLALVAVIALAAVGYRFFGDRITPQSALSGNSSSSSEPSSSSDEQTQEVQKAPDFQVYDAQGNSVTLSEQFGQGKPVVVNFWASWCGPCKSEMPDFDEVYQTYGDRVIFMMVNLTDGAQETQQKAEAFIEESGYSFPVYFDLDSSAASAYSVYSIPSTFVMDADGYAQGYAKGMIAGEDLAAFLDTLLESES